MQIFGFLKKKKIKGGQISKIAELKTPYLLKTESASGRRKKKFGSFKKPVFVAPKAPKTRSPLPKIILAIILAFGLTAFTIYALFFSNYFIIKKYSIDDDLLENGENEKLNQVLDTSIGKNLVTFNDETIRQQILTEHPEIKNLKIKKIFPSSLEIIIEKYPVTANIINSVNGIQKKFLVNSQGLVIEENNENPDLPYIKLDTEKYLKLNEPFLNDSKRSTERLTYSIKAINLFEEKFGIRILYAVLKTRERELHLYTEKYFYVMLDMEKGAPNTEQGLLEQIQKLKKALSKLDIYNSPLVYIDLRISGTDTEKVIFKRK